MKRHTLIYLFLCLTIVCAFAAQAQRSFRVHKSDGNMQSFFYSALDSITFSNIDLDGVSHDAVVVQEFHTPDSIYRIPLAEIDSVAFTTPPTVYKPNRGRIAAICPPCGLVDVMAASGNPRKHHPSSGRQHRHPRL